MKQFFLAISILCTTCKLIAQSPASNRDSMTIFFNQAKDAIASNYKLWDKDFYGPILVVEPKTRTIIANYPDTLGTLKKQGELYYGILPAGINIANYVIKWNGRNWAMIMTNLIPSKKEDRINLFAHELFHRVQEELGFKLLTPDNKHLDKKNGRIYLRLELEALKKAALASEPKSMQRHLANSFLFRKYRYQLFPGADTAENWLELNEGITEYTGLIIDGRSNDEAIMKLTRKIEGMQAGDVSFVRNFAYATTPVHGYLLRKRKRYWNKEINSGTSLTNFFISAFHLKPPDISLEKIQQIAKEYNGDSITSQENRREEKLKTLISEYKLKLVEQPHTEIQCYSLKFTANTGTQLPIENLGTIYQSFFNGADEWGSLIVEKGGILVTAGKKSINISMPLSIEGNTVKGENWVLKLNEGYKIEKETESGNFIVRKK